MRIKLKLVVYALALVLLLCVLPQLATPAEAATYSGTCGESTTWTMDIEAGVLTISGSGEMDDYYSPDDRYFVHYAPPWYGPFRDSIKTVVIEDGVTSIGTSAFYGCTSLTSVAIPNSVSHIGSFTFRNCSSLVSVTIPVGVTYIPEDMFRMCSSLTSVEIPDSVRSIGDSAFSFCDSLTSVVIPDSVRSIGDSAFFYCDSLTSVTIPSGVTEIGYDTFRCCESLASVVIPDSVTSIGYQAFLYCRSLTSVVIPDSVTSIEEDAFASCSSLTSVTIGAGVTTIGRYAFGECYSISSVMISDLAAWCRIVFESEYSNPMSNGDVDLYLNGELVEYLVIPEGITAIQDYAFCDCGSLVSVTIPDGVTTIGEYAFYSDGMLTASIPASVTQIESNAFFLVYEGIGGILHMLYTGTEEQWCAINMGSETDAKYYEAMMHYGARGDEVTVYETCVCHHAYCSLCDKIYAYWYWQDVSRGHSFTDGACTACGLPEGLKYDLEKSPPHIEITDYTGDAQYLEIPAEIEKLPVTVIREKAIFNCDTLISVTIPDSVTKLEGSAFSCCDSLKTVTIPGSLSEIGYSAFSQCRSLESVMISDGVTSIGGHAFYDCGKLASVTIPDSVRNIGDWAFCHCISLTSVTIPYGVVSIGELAFNGCGLSSIVIPDSVTNIGESAFDNCSALASAKLSENMTGISDQLFCCCDSLSSITIPDSVTSIGRSAFSSCSSLSSIAFSNNVTSIGDSAFSNCDSLTSVTIPDSVTGIGEGVFYDCDSLTSVTIPDSVISIGESAFQWCAGLQNVYISDIAAWCQINFAARSSNPLSTNASLYLNEKPVEHLVIPDGVWGINNYAFIGDNGIVSVTIPDSVNEIGKTIFDSNSSLCHVLYTGTEAQWGAIRIDTDNAGITGISHHAGARGNEIEFYDTCIGRYAYCSLCDSIIFTEAFENGGHRYLDGTCSGCGLPEGLKYNLFQSPAHIEITDYRGDAEQLVIPAEIEGLPVTILCNYAFADCANLTSVTIPDSVTDIGASAFYNCSALTTVHIGKGVRAIGERAFCFCPALTEIRVSAKNPNYSSDAFGILFDKNKATLLVCPGGFEGSYVVSNGVTAIAPYAFYDCNALTELTIADTVTEIGDEAFYSCDRLYLVTLGSGVKYIGEDAFNDCYNLFHVLFRGTEAQWETITFEYGNSVLSSRYHCGAMGNEVRLYETCGGRYAYCDFCQRGVGYLPGGGKGHSFAEGICASCGVPEYLYYDINCTTGDVIIWGFDGNASSLIIPTTIEQLPVVHIGYQAFKNQRGLIDVSLGENVEEIGYQAFAGCHNLVNISFGSGITTIHQGAFYECPKLSHVLFTGTEAQWNRIDVDLDNLTILEAMIHYHAAADAVCWKNVSDTTFLYCTICETALTEGCTHGQTELRAAVEPTCTEPGYTGDIRCAVCGELLAEGETIDPLGHDFEDGFCALCGEKDPNALPENPFTDVKEGDYYFTPILWAVQNGITNGTSTTEFSPEAPCTRGQIVTFLWRAFGSPEPTKTENPFTDVPENMYYYKAILWAVEQGITTGTSATTFSPEATCTRGQVATFLWRACGKPAPEGGENPFTDVPQTVYYYEPILWAVENGVTNGTGGGKFSPEDSCTRGQIVTFLYRALAE